MVKDIYYNGTKLINIRKDAAGLLPEIYCVDGNRNAGKTTWFKRYFVNRFKKHKEKFMLLYRFGNQLTSIDQKFWKDIHFLFFKDDELSIKPQDKGSYIELFLNGESCGYATAINSADKVKENSHMFTDVKRIFFDEFQATKYVPDEVDKLFSIHTSIARGPNQPVRYVPVYMCCNHVSSLNPYYRAWHCASQVDEIQEGFYIGNGFVIEKNMNTVVSEKQKEGGFNRAFSSSQVYKHTVENESLLDNRSFVEEIKSGDFKYICTINVDGSQIALKQVRGVSGVMFYFTDKIDPSYKTRYAVNTEDHSGNTVLLGRSAMLIMQVKKCFEAGFVRFSSLEVKGSAFEFLMLMI